MTRARSIGVALALALLPALAQAKDLQIASAWAAAAVNTDGSAGEWSAVLRPLGDPPIVIGVRNDAEYLYLCVKTSDLKVKRQLGVAGLTVWANGEGKTQKGFGVRFPVRRAAWMRAGGGADDRPQGSPPGGDQSPPPPGDGGRANGLEGGSTEVELIGPTAEDRLNVQPGVDEPVAAALGDDAGVTVIEYRIPLKPTEAHPLAVGAAPGATIALGLETEKLKSDESRTERAGRARGGEGGEGGPGVVPGGGYGGRGGYGGGPGGMGGGYGGGRHGAGGGTREGGREAGTPIKLWFKVALASPPTGAGR